MKTIIKITLIIFMSLCSSFGHAELIKTLLGDTKPKQINVDPTSLYVRTVWPDGINTVGQAITYILEPSGYKLLLDYPAPSDAYKLANEPIPPIAKIHRTMPVIDAIQILIGTDNFIFIDHRNKLISFSRSK